jgi:hypothetical protein
VSFEDLKNRFNYHAPTEGKIADHAEVRSRLLEVAEFFDNVLPEGREKSLALTKLEEAMFWANASIARN